MKALRILGKLGEGAMGEVYRAADATLDTEVAIEVLSAESSNNDTRPRLTARVGRR